MAENGGGNPGPRAMVAAQPPALSPRPPVLDDLRDQVSSISEKQLISAGSPSSIIFYAEPRSEMSSTSYSVSGRAVGRLAARLCPEYRLSTNERRSFTHENALTELAVRSSLSGRFCDAGCNTTSPQCLRNAGRATRTLCTSAKRPRERMSIRPSRERAMSSGIARSM